MTKIRSTIDIVMEKTKDLSVTEEEKQAFHHDEWLGKLKGWVQKFVDGLIKIEELKKDVDAGIKDDPSLRDAMKQELINHLEPDSDNSKIFSALQETLGISAEPYVKMIRSFQGNEEVYKTERIEDLKQELKKQGIYGSSVIPNITHDKAWMDQMKADFLQQMKSITNN